MYTYRSVYWWRNVYLVVVHVSSNTGTLTFTELRCVKVVTHDCVRKVPSSFLSSETSHLAFTLPSRLISGILTYLLTPLCGILFEKLILTQLVKKSHFLYETLRFISVFTQARHWTLS
jgi:hypothetical protein